MRILCIGDSNTWGYNPANGERLVNRWTRVLMQMMPEHEIIEEGLNGRTLCSPDPVKAERCGITALKMLLMSHKPVDLVILMLGTNELKKCFDCSAKRIAGEVGEFIKIIRNPDSWQKFNVPRLLVVSPILIRDELAQGDYVFDEFDAESVMQSKLLATEISEVCDEYGVDFMNAAEFAESSILDNIHMDEENHKKLAVALANKITDLKDMLVVLKRAGAKKKFENQEEFRNVLMQIEAADRGLVLDWDDGAGEEWARFSSSEVGKVCMINSVIGLAFLRAGYENQEVLQLLEDCEVVFVEDFHSGEWFIDLDKLRKEVWEMCWKTSEEIVNPRCFSLDEFYYATV